MAPTPGSDVALQKRFETALMLKLKGFVVVPENIEHDDQLFPAANCGYGIVKIHFLMFTLLVGLDAVLIGIDV